MALFKNEPDTKLNNIFIVWISFWARNAIKNETKNVNKSSAVSSIFVIVLIYWPQDSENSMVTPSF